MVGGGGGRPSWTALYNCYTMSSSLLAFSMFTSVSVLSWQRLVDNSFLTSRRKISNECVLLLDLSSKGALDKVSTM